MHFLRATFLNQGIFVVILVYNFMRSTVRELVAAQRGFHGNAFVLLCFCIPTREKDWFTVNVSLFLVFLVFDSIGDHNLKLHFSLFALFVFCLFATSKLIYKSSFVYTFAFRFSKLSVKSFHSFAAQVEQLNFFCQQLFFYHTLYSRPASSAELFYVVQISEKIAVRIELNKGGIGHSSMFRCKFCVSAIFWIDAAKVDSSMCFGSERYVLVVFRVRYLAPFSLEL